MGNRNKRKNELFIGKEFLTKEGRTIKHASLIEHYANVNPSKTRETFIQLIGVDIETNYLTGNMRLCGFYEGNFDDYGETFNENGNPITPYRPYTSDFFENLVSTVKYAIKGRKHLAYWSNLDASQIVKEFIKANYHDYVINDVLERYKKVAGEYNHKTGEWEVRPVISVDMGLFIVGIKQAIRDSIQFFIQFPNGEVKTCWGYNIKALYMRGLEAEADSSVGGRFDWYSKIGDEAHLLGEPEWERFHNDKDFRDMVLKSNRLDAKGAMALGYEIQKDFNEAFKYEDETGVLNSYPTSLISQGAHARSAVACQVRNDLIRENGFKVENITEEKHEDRKALYQAVSEKLKSIPLITHLDNWRNKHHDLEHELKDFYSMVCEAYSGGYIDAISYGSADEAYIADVASAYPAVIQNLYDLTDSEFRYGTGEPPHIEYAYTFCRGLVNIPKGLDFHPITIKHELPEMKDINVRFEGSFIASYTKDERDFIVSVGGSFEDETWYSVVTKGKPAVQSGVSIKLGDLRNHYLSIGSRTEALIKRINNSGYGILFEAVPIFEEIEGVPTRVGYRAGEFFNPLYASIITARTRIIMSSASYEIKKNGGQVCAIMTDSVSWTGTKDMLPKVLPFSWGESGIKLEKTFGYFEEPETLRNLVVLGAGLYGYDKIDVESDTVSYTVNKRRGFNISGLLNEDEEIIEGNFNWSNVLEEMVRVDSDELTAMVRVMVSVGILAHQRETYTVEDLGRVLDTQKHIKAISGKGKRIITEEMRKPKMLSNNMMKTNALYVSYNTGGNGYVNGSLPILREEMMKLEMKTSKIIKADNNRNRQKRFYDNNKDDKKLIRKKKYDLARANGFSSYQAQKLQGWNMDKLVKLFESGLTYEEFIEKEENEK